MDHSLPSLRNSRNDLRTRIVLQSILLFCIYETAETSYSMMLHHSPDLSDSTFATDILIQLIDSCFADKSLVIPIKSGEFQSDEFIHKIFAQNKYDMILIDNSIEAYYNVNLKTKNNIFVVPVNSKNSSTEMLSILKRSPYWNHLGLFIFIDINCNDAENILKAAWEMNIQSSLVVCIDDDHEPMIFTSNPFTNRAPEPWIQVASQSEKNLTFYRQKYHKALLCDTLNYKRDQILDGYPVTFVKKDESNPKVKRGISYRLEDYEAMNTLSYESHVLSLLKILSKIMNATAFVFIDKNSNIKFNYKSFNTKQSDTSYYCMTYTESGNKSYLLSFPVIYDSLSILSHTQGFYTPLEKIWNFFGILTIASMFILLVITFFVILKIQKRSPSFATFEILRLIINTSLLTRMETVSIRIFFTVVFLYFLIIQALFQGNLSKFLTKPSAKPNIDFIKDLNNPSIDKVYIFRDVEIGNDFIRDIESFRDKVTFVKTSSCFNNVIHNKTAACIGTRVTLESFLHLNKTLHIGQNFYPAHYVFVARDDWPLINYFDSAILRLHENGYLNFLEEKIVSKSLIAQEKMKALSDQDQKPISLHDIFFAFIILFIGLAVAFLVFLLEIYGKKLKKR